jgi:hypothetical protein
MHVVVRRRFWRFCFETRCDENLKLVRHLYEIKLLDRFAFWFESTMESAAGDIDIPIIHIRPADIVSRLVAYKRPELPSSCFPGSRPLG